MLALFDLPQASSMAGRIDHLYDFVFWISLVSFVGIVAGLLYFTIHYRRAKRPPEQTPYIEGHTPLELAVSGILFILVMVIFAWGWIDYTKILQKPVDALEINLIGKQWLWEMEYTNGRRMVNELVVPKGEPVTLLMSSQDVIHSFFVPAFRLKQDVVPGAYTSLSFTPIKTGEFPAYCAEYCGTAHSSMIAKVRVLEPKDYERWKMSWELEQRLGTASASAAGKDLVATGDVVDEKPIERGKRVFAEKGCNACHTLTGQTVVGPSLLGLFGKKREFASGKAATADENYIRESLMDPQKELVKGFQPVMPTYRGQLTDAEVNGLIAYIKSLKE